MSDLFLWFPEDFDKRYEKYREEQVESKMPEPFLVERLLHERENFLQINNEEEYQHEFGRWKPLKTIVDSIYSELSPLTEMPQNVKIDLEKLGISKNVASPILLTLVQEGVCRWRLDKFSVVISTAPINEYLQGSGIVVQNYKKFKDFRKEVNNFFNYVEHHQGQKFPKVQTSKSTPDEEIDTTVKRVAVWGGETVSDLPLIEYNEATGKGEVVGKKKFKFKDGSPEYKVFKILYTKLGKKPAKLERQDVLITVDFYKDYEKPDLTRKTAETALINDIAKNIREKTGVNTEELVNNNGSLTLLALRQDKNPPKVTKYVPVWG